MSEFWLGLLALPALALAGIVLWGSWIGLNWLNNKVDEYFLSHVKVPKNRKKVFWDEDEEDQREEYEDAGEKLKRAVMRSPKVHVLKGFGWRILIVRDQIQES